MKRGVFAVGGSQFEQWLPGLWGSAPHFELLLILPPLRSLVSIVSAASMPIPRRTHQKAICRIRCLVGYSFSGGSRHLDYPT